MRKKIDWTDENRIMIFALPTCVAAQNLGIHPESVRRAKRRFLQKKEKALFNNRTPFKKTIGNWGVKTLPQGNEPAPEVQINPVIAAQEVPVIPEAPPAPPAPPAPAKPKLKPSLQEILLNFPDLTVEQRKTAIMLFRDSPMSAYRYCQLIQNWRINKQNEPINIRYNRRRKASY